MFATFVYGLHNQAGVNLYVSSLVIACASS
jgi:hypothetical protein